MTREVELDVGAIIVATGFKPFDARRIPQYGYGKYPNVYTALEVERLLNASGPTQGEIVLRNGERPQTVGIIHCVGSRDARYNPYCSRVCCMYSLKLAHLIKERTGAEVYSFYIDMRTPGKGYEEFYEQVMKEGVHLIRGRVAEVSDEADSPEAEGKLVLRAEDTLAGRVRQIPVDMVVLAVALEPQADAEHVRRLLNISCGSRGLLHRTAPEARPGVHVHRRRLPRRRLPGAQGHPGHRGPGRRGRGGGPGDDRPRLHGARAEHGVRRRGEVLRLPHLRRPLPVRGAVLRRRSEGRGGQRGALQGVRRVRRRLPVGRACSSTCSPTSRSSPRLEGVLKSV